MASVSDIRAHQGFFKHRLLIRELQLLKLLIDLLHICHGGARGQATVGLCVFSTKGEDRLQTLSLLERRGEREVSGFMRMETTLNKKTIEAGTTGDFIPHRNPQTLGW